MQGEYIIVVYIDGGCFIRQSGQLGENVLVFIVELML